MKISAQRLIVIYSFILPVVFIAGCSSTKEIRYEENKKKEEIEIKAPPIYKTMEVRERELILNSRH